MAGIVDTAGSRYPVEHRFVGRAAELGELAGLLEAALGGRPGVALVGGEPGIGKTRLVSELTRLAGARAVPVLWGGCSEDIGAPAYWPWRRALRGREVPPALDPIVAAAPPRPAGPAERFALFAAVAEFLLATATPTGLVVVLDDLQWADPASVALLAHVAREPDARLLLLGTHRPAEQRVALVDVPGRRLQLRGLDAGEIEQLTGVGGTGAALRERTGGNPFFVRALLQSGPESGPGSGAAVPETVRDVVARRVARLPEPCRAQLGRAAVVGRECELTLLTGADPLTDLRPAVRDGLVERVGPRVRFTHDLVREALLADLPDREAVHLALVEALAPQAADPEVLPVLARHALAALPLGDRDAALRWAEAAGDLALRRLAYEEAARLFGLVLDERPAGRLDLLLRTAEVLGWSHAVEAAAERAAQAVDLARQLGDPAAIGRAALVLPGVSEPEWIEVSRAWTDEALAGLPAEDTPLRARLLAQRAQAAASGSDRRPVEADSAAALAMAERVDDPSSLVAALRARQFACSGPDGQAERLGLGTRLLALADRTGDPDDALWGRLWRFDALVQAGDVAGAEREVELLDPLVTRLRRPLARVHLLRSRATLAVGRGRFAEATALNEEAGRLGRGTGTGVATSALRFAISALTGDVCPEQEWLPELARDDATPNVAIVRAELAHWYVEQGRRAEAEQVYRQLPPVGSSRIPPYTALVVECRRAIAAADLGDRTAGEAGLGWLRRYVHLFQVGGAGALAIMGSVHQYAGAAAQAAGRTEAAVAHLRAGIVLDDARGLRPFAALGRARLAGLVSDRRAAAELSAAALRTARELGMVPLARRIGEPGPLSPREAEIAALIGQGLTNRRIAAQEHISERTVETHVQHILAKLGFSRRAQIAAWVARGHR